VKQSFFLRGQCLGSRKVPPGWFAGVETAARGTWLQPSNLAYFCSECGEIWGRVTYEQEDQFWQIHVRECGEHGTENVLTPWMGSFRSIGQGDLLTFAADWPVEVVRREFDLLMDKMEKGLLDV